MQTVCIKKVRGRTALQDTLDIKKQLNSFYQTNFLPLLGTVEQLDYENLTQILQYLSVDILKDYKNNIIKHYVEYVERYVNVIFDKEKNIEKLKQSYNSDQKEALDDDLRELNSQLRKIKNDILNVDTTYQSIPDYHDFINESRKNATPNKGSYLKNNLVYDLKANPMDYLPSMIFMMREIETKGMKMSNVFPIRTGIEPKHITIDTVSLVKLIYDRNRLGLSKPKQYYQDHIKDHEDSIWSFFFNTKLPCFKKTGYAFHHMIKTDGVSCSVILIRKDLIGKLIPKKQDHAISEKYIDELSDYSEFEDKKIVAYDPGKCDLIYCIDGVAERDGLGQVINRPNEYRYTQDQRRKESKSKKFTKLIEGFKQEKINGKTVMEHESELSKYNRKTLATTKFEEYIRQKVKLNKTLWTFYGAYIFRKLKLNGYWNRQKSEQRMIENFKRIFGPPEEVIIVAGDFEQKKHMKYKEPTKGKGIRTIFRKHGYKLYLVDEHRSSCRCAKCGGECKKFMRRKNPKPYRTGEVLVHGLLSCTNCGNVWNRDVNGATNIWIIASDAISGKGRPEYLKHQPRNKSLALDDAKKLNREQRGKIAVMH